MSLLQYACNGHLTLLQACYWLVVAAQPGPTLITRSTGSRLSVRPTQIFVRHGLPKSGVHKFGGQTDRLQCSAHDECHWHCRSAHSGGQYTTHAHLVVVAVCKVPNGAGDRDTIVPAIARQRGALVC
jgi:hypothetical protein